MNKINYRSDFTISLAFLTPAGDPIGLPPFDFVLRLSTAALGNYFQITQTDGVLTNAIAAPNGSLTLILDNHHLFPGQLQAHLSANIPDPLYPDGFRRIEARQTLQTTLDRDTTTLDYDTISETLIIPLTLPEILSLPPYPPETQQPSDPSDPSDPSENPDNPACNCPPIASTDEILSSVDNIFS